MTYDVFGRLAAFVLVHGGGTGLDYNGGSKVYGFAANWLGSRLIHSTDVYMNQSGWEGVLGGGCGEYRA